MRLIAGVGITLLLLAGSLGAAEPATLTLEQAIAAVEKTNLNVLLSREAIAQAVEQMRLARSTTLPNVGASATQRRARSISITNTTPNITPATSRFDGQL